MRLRSALKPIEWDMTSMIDVVFLLIVFFTLVINFTAADQDERIKLPISELAQPPEHPPTEPITLHILTNGNIIYNGVEQPLSTLRESIDSRLRVQKYMNIPLEKITVVLRADAKCEARQILDTIECCQGFHLTQFDLRTKLREE